MVPEKKRGSPLDEGVEGIRLLRVPGVHVFRRVREVRVEGDGFVRGRLLTLAFERRRGERVRGESAFARPRGAVLHKAEAQDVGRLFYFPALPEPAPRLDDLALGVLLHEL